MRVSELGEDGLLKRIVPILPQAQKIEVPSGDDCAVLGLSEGRVAVSTDMLVEGRHFRRDWSTGYDVGWRAAMQNLADSVAMGARPVSLVVALQLPGDTEVSWVDDFTLGLSDAARTIGCGIDGGDLTSGDHICIGVTVLGDLEGRTPLQRGAAAVGEKLVHAGVLGIAGAGLAVLSGQVDKGKEEQEFARQHCVSSFLRPNPPLNAVLAACEEGKRSNGQAKLSALMDVSDGLIKDARRMAKASHVWIDIDSLELAPDVWQLKLAGFKEDQARQLVLNGGEDHGFLGTLAFSPLFEKQEGKEKTEFNGLDMSLLPEGFRVIGTVRQEWEGGLVTLDGEEIDGAGGWDHFSK